MNSKQDIINKENQSKEEIIQFSLPEIEEKYNVQIYLSKNKYSIIFKIEEINNFSHYFYEKLDPRDFKKKYKDIISHESIKDIFYEIKNIINKNKLRIEEQMNKMNLIIIQNNDKAEIIFILRKRYICQNKVNLFLTERIKDNFKKIKKLENQMNNFVRNLNEENDIINNINDKILNINNKINSIYQDLNYINNALKNPLISKNNENKSLLSISKDKNDENKNFKSNHSCFLLFVLNIIIFIFLYNLFIFVFSVENAINISIKSGEDFYAKFSILESIFGIKNNSFESDEIKAKEKNINNVNKKPRIQDKKVNNNFNHKKFNNNQNYDYLQFFFQSDEALNIIKKLNIKIMIIDENINLMGNDTLKNQEAINYFTKQIIMIKNNTINDIKLTLKYSKVNSEKNFYFNSEAFKENLICFQNSKNNIIYIFSPNIVKLIDYISKKSLEKLKNEVIYIFKYKENYEEKISDAEILRDVFDNTLDLCNNGNNKYKCDLKIYEVNYIVSNKK